MFHCTNSALITFVFSPLLKSKSVKIVTLIVYLWYRKTNHSSVLIIAITQQKHIWGYFFTSWKSIYWLEFNFTSLTTISSTGINLFVLLCWIKRWNEINIPWWYRESLFLISIDALFIPRHECAFISVTHPFPLPIQSQWFIEMHILFAIDYIHNLLKAFCSVPVMSAGLQTALI